MQFAQACPVSGLGRQKIYVIFGCVALSITQGHAEGWKMGSSNEVRKGPARSLGILINAIIATIFKIDRQSDSGAVEEVVLLRIVHGRSDEMNPRL